MGGREQQVPHQEAAMMLYSSGTTPQETNTAGTGARATVGASSFLAMVFLLSLPVFCQLITQVPSG